MRAMGGSSGIARLLLAGLVLSLGSLGASAQEPPPASRADVQNPGSARGAPQARAVKPTAKPYFVEFRARNAASYGHTFLVHGRVGEKLTEKSVVGLHPFTNSSIPWLLGHIVMVPSETGFSDGDIEDEYILARYRILLTKAEYDEATAFMRKLQASSPVWHAVFYNCNAFVADIAKSMGLKTPSSTMLYPKDFISELRQLNDGKSDLAGVRKQRDS